MAIKAYLKGKDKPKEKKGTEYIPVDENTYALTAILTELKQTMEKMRHGR